MKPNLESNYKVLYPEKKCLKQIMQNVKNSRASLVAEW